MQVKPYEMGIWGLRTIAAPDHVGMPELPDVEIFRRYLDATSLHQRIRGVEAHRARDALEGVSASRLRESLVGASLEETSRRGKHLGARLSRDKGWLTLHFGMTGFLDDSETEPPPEHSRVILWFTRSRRLAWVCQRLLGKVGLVDDFEEFLDEQGVGPDALSLSLSDLRDLRAHRRGSIKSLLMNQGAIGGIGNVYSDEILFQAGVHPAAEVKKLTDAQAKELHRQMRRVLETAIEKKADPTQMPRRYLLPHREEGAPNPRGDGVVKTLKVNGRTCSYCPQRQKKAG